MGLILGLTKGLRVKMLEVFPSDLTILSVSETDTLKRWTEKDYFNDKS